MRITSHFKLCAAAAVICLLAACTSAPEAVCPQPLPELLQPGAKDFRIRLDEILRRGEAGEDVGPDLFALADDGDNDAAQLLSLINWILSTAPVAD